MTIIKEMKGMGLVEVLTSVQHRRRWSPDQGTEGTDWFDLDIPIVLVTALTGYLQRLLPQKALQDTQKIYDQNK